MKKTSFIYRNSLSIVFLFLTLSALFGQFVTGLHTKNEELLEKGLPQFSWTDYMSSGHFIQATFENWESEFLQMMLYVVLTIWLRQKGSSESKGLDGPEDVDREPVAHADAPWPVKKGGVWLTLYKHSLSMAFAILFLACFALHFFGSMKDYNSEQLSEGKLPVTVLDYLTNSRFWFESFQNWQSEFLSVAAIVLLSVWLREKGSPESKPVDMPHYENP